MKIGPNELCWCGSQLKYKKCHSSSDRLASVSVKFRNGVPEEDRQKYEQVLTEIRDRVEYGLASVQAPISRVRLECAALHLRMVLELIIFGAFVNNREVVAQISSNRSRGELSGRSRHATCCA
jgi:hypothetical protein